MYLSEATFRKNNVRDNTNIEFYSAPANIFPPSASFAGALQSIADGKGIRSHFKHVLKSIDKDNRVATFHDVEADQMVS